MVLLLLRLSGWVGEAVVVHHPVLRRSTTGWSCHSLPLLGFLVGADGIIHDHDIADKLWKCSPVVGAMRYCSLEERTIMKWSFFFSSVSTSFGAYYVMWLTFLE
jgi:hypothetical protein